MASLSRPIRPVMAASSGQKSRRPSWVSVVASVGTPLVLGQAVGLWSTRDILQWYPKLRKPDWTPPAQFFGPTWGALYCAMGLAAHRVWAAGAGQGVMALYFVQLALNLCWQPLFFKAHNLQVAAWDLAALLATLVPTIRSFAKYDSMAAGLMVPYALFSVFATALNLKILNLNGPKPEF